MSKRTEALRSIRDHICKFGHHIYLVSGGPCPRHAYTIGLTDVEIPELVLAGCVFYQATEVKQIINGVARLLRAGTAPASVFRLGSLGDFTLRPMHLTWTSRLLLGAHDYYQSELIDALQIIPDDAHWTADVPDMSGAVAVEDEPIWKWLSKPWPYAVPSAMVAVTNLAALQGQRVTEVARWENDQWEAFAVSGGEVPADEVRIVPLGVLIGIDPSMRATLGLSVGDGLFRGQNDDEWQVWD